MNFLQPLRYKIYQGFFKSRKRRIKSLISTNEFALFRRTISFHSKRSFPSFSTSPYLFLNQHDISKQTQQRQLYSLVNSLPKKIQPYAKLARIDKPIGTMLLLWPCLCSTALATPSSFSLPPLSLLALFSIGSFVMRGAGCTINDMWDAKYDKLVKRTAARPLAQGDLTHSQALGFLVLQLSAGLGVLVSLPHTLYCVQWGVAALPLVVAYPYMKRVTNMPQLFLGITFNWGAFMGWAATHGTMEYSVVIPFYVGCVAWTLMYDTLYAHQDKHDDEKLGLKSTALFFAHQTKPILYGFSSIAAVGWTTAGISVGYDSPLFFSGMGLAYAHLLWQVYTADLDNEENLAQRFRSNQYLGGILFSSYVLGNAFT